MGFRGCSDSESVGGARGDLGSEKDCKERLTIRFAPHNQVNLFKSYITFFTGSTGPWLVWNFSGPRLPRPRGHKWKDHFFEMVDTLKVVQKEYLKSFSPLLYQLPPNPGAWGTKIYWVTFRVEVLKKYTKEKLVIGNAQNAQNFKDWCTKGHFFRFILPLSILSLLLEIPTFFEFDLEFTMEEYDWNEAGDIKTQPTKPVITHSDLIRNEHYIM